MNESILPTQALVVFGGLNGWGKKIADTCRDVARAVAIVDQTTSNVDARNAVTHADTVFLAAPDSEIRNILQSHRDLLREKNLLDCATSKSNFSDLLKEIAQKCDVCSTHPMVRSETPSRGQNVLLMPVGNASAQSKTIAQEIFNRLGMNIRDFDFEKHGKLMSILQFVPHMVQRVLIGSLGQIFDEHNFSIDDIGQFAPANFLATELGIGRVGIQRPSVSAGIIVDALQTEFGRHVFQVIQNTIAEFEKTVERNMLERRLSEEFRNFDRANSWKKRMEEKTEIIIEAMGNLNARSFQVLSDRDEPGLLRDICTILAQHNINMTAMHSHVIESDTGRRGVRFDIGIDDVTVDWQCLQEEFQAHGFQITKEKVV